MFHTAQEELDERNRRKIESQQALDSRGVALWATLDDIKVLTGSITVDTLESGRGVITVAMEPTLPMIVDAECLESLADIFRISSERVNEAREMRAHFGRSLAVTPES